MRKKHSKQEKAKIVLELLREEKTVNQIVSEHGVHPSQLSQWKKTALEGLPDLFERKERELRKIEKEAPERSRPPLQENWRLDHPG
jgi:putative transposase